MLLPAWDTRTEGEKNYEARVHRNHESWFFNISVECGQGKVSSRMQPPCRPWTPPRPALRLPGAHSQDVLQGMLVAQPPWWTPFLGASGERIYTAGRSGKKTTSQLIMRGHPEGTGITTEGLVGQGVTPKQSSRIPFGAVVLMILLPQAPVAGDPGVP